MHYELNERIQTAMREWVAFEEWSNPYAITLTMKQNRDVKTLRGQHTISLDDIAASRNFGYFMHRLNRKVYGRQAKRYGRILRVVPILERSKGTDRLHFHAGIERPDKITDEAFRSLIKEQWYKTPWAYYQIDIQDSADDGWISYITKFSDKESVAESIDWDNVHNII